MLLCKKETGDEMMNRRELISHAAAAVTAIVPGMNVETVEAKKPLLIKLKCIQIDPEQQAIVREYLRRMFAGTELEGVPMVFCINADIDIVEDPRG